MNQARLIEQVPKSKTVALSSQENKEAAKKKTLNYQAHEDLGLCVLWIRITKDPMVDTNQDGGTFWKEVAIHYAKEVPGSSQTSGSLKA